MKRLASEAFKVFNNERMAVYLRTRGHLIKIILSQFNESVVVREGSPRRFGALIHMGVDSRFFN